MSPPAENQPTSEGIPVPADGGTLLPPPAAVEASRTGLQGLTSADSSLIGDTSHVQQLISHGADVNAPDNNGWTPLHTAAYHGQEEIVRILLGANADVNARNKIDETPLHLAAKWPQDRVVEALLSGGADLTARNKRGRTPAHVAALFNRHGILERILNAGADVNARDADQQTPLHLAVRVNTPVEPELVKTLIRHNADLEARDVHGNLPLHFLPNAQDWLHWAAYEGKEVLMQVLLSKPGVRPDCYSDEGLTPLHMSAHINNTNMVSMLLDAGAKVNAPSQPPIKPSGKETTYGIPLPGAPGSITAGISISSQIKAYGSSKLPPGELTALHIAAERGSAELIRLLVTAGAKVNVQGERGMPPLHVAVWEGNTAAVVSLLAAKASVSLKSKAGGFTAVHCACLSPRATPELMGLLLDNGGAAVIEERCQEGWTALHLACQSAPPAMVELLLQRGARPNAKGKAGRTAADCAAKRPEILSILHVATGGKVPLPLGLTAAAAAAANGLLAPNAASPSANNGGVGGASSNTSVSSGGVSAAASALVRSAAAAGGSGSGGSRSGGSRNGPTAANRNPGATTPSSSSSSQPGLLPGTAAVLAPLESVEATLAALLADMGGALCSLQAGGVFGAGACAVDPVGHCIRPLDKRLVMVCTLGCQFSFHLQCWKSAREVLKERWTGFTGSLTASGRYCCIAPGCPGFIREQAICDGTQMQAAGPSRLYVMPQEMYDSLTTQAKPIGGGVPLPPGEGSNISGGGGMQQPATPLQPALPAGGGLSSLAALAPSLTLAQAMVQAATAVGNMVGGSGRLAGNSLAAALAASGGLPALLAGNGPPVPPVMSAREACVIAAQTLGLSSGSGGSSCVVEDIFSGDESDEDYDVPPPTLKATVTAAAVTAGGGEGSTKGRKASNTSRGSGGVVSGATGSSAAVSTANSGSGSNGASRKPGSGGGGGSSSSPAASGASSSSRRGGKGTGGKTLGGKSSSTPPISSAAAAEMLQQLQGLQQAVAAVQSAVGAGVHSMGLGMNQAGQTSSATAAAANTAGHGGTSDTTTVPSASSAAPASATAAAVVAPPGTPASTTAPPSACGGRAVPESQVTLEPLPKALLPVAAVSNSCLPSGDPGADGDPSGSGGGSLQDPTPMPPPRRRTPPMPPMSRRPQPPLGSTAQDSGRHPVSPQLATPPPATSLLTPGVQQLLSRAAGLAAAAVQQQPRQQPDASLAPILVGPVPQPSGTSGPSSSCTGGASAAKSPPSQSRQAVGELPRPTARQPGGSALGRSSSPQRSLATCPDGGAAQLTPDAMAASPANGSTAAAAATTTTATACIVSARFLSTAASVPVSLSLDSGQYEPGGYARAVCPGLRPGVHRVTRSTGRGPATTTTVWMSDEIVRELDASTRSACISSGGGSCNGKDSGAETTVETTENGHDHQGGVDEDPSLLEGAGGVPLGPEMCSVEPASGTQAEARTLDNAKDNEDSERGSAAPAGPVLEQQNQLQDQNQQQQQEQVLSEDESPASPRFQQPHLDEPVPVPIPEHDTVATVPRSAGDNDNGTSTAAASTIAAVENAGPSTEAANTTAAANATPSTPNAGVDSFDIVVAALRGLASSSGMMGAGSPPADSGPGPGGSSRHLLLQSSDIPLLAGTPGMLEAWLHAHVAVHGRLVAHRILAPQSAVAVTLESGEGAAAAVRSLASRPTLLMAPLLVAPLRAFPEDEELAASAQQAARSACAPGDRSWMGHMVRLWERLQELPATVRHA